ncbi:hypothetical protein BDR04DRAFT_1158772 [Suillus decipiens]|nr:hypothetical protein BDR04DRAFT_1158772 [Suillus decipiens]
MCILFAAGGSAVQELNYRYHQVPTFGRGTIRWFYKNASAMKCLAACDFEDLLQCTIPVFKGLLPPDHDMIILDLLFDLATWHAYAKLCLHMDDTLAFFDSVTVILGQLVCKFQHTTCAYYHTTELLHDRIGHKATRDWDEILQLKQDGAKEAEAEEGDDVTDIAEEGEEDQWEDIESLDDVDKSDEDDNDDEDRIIADEGEELDEDVLAEEGYGAL